MCLQALDNVAMAWDQTWDLAWAQALATTAQVLAAAWVLTHPTTAQVGLVLHVLLAMLVGLSWMCHKLLHQWSDLSQIVVQLC